MKQFLKDTAIGALVPIAALLVLIGLLWAMANAPWTIAVVVFLIIAILFGQIIAESGGSLWK